MKLFRTVHGVAVEDAGNASLLPGQDWDELVNTPDLPAHLRLRLRSGAIAPLELADHDLLPPIGTQEVWAAGVTYLRSREARMEESKDAGGGSFYDRVYAADRPELFFKAVAHRVVGHGGQVRTRADSNWNVPEPELTLLINRDGRIVGYTIGNDMSSRDIEGENPLYLPQAKVYDGSCALGPGVLVAEEPLPAETPIRITIRRGLAADAFTGATTLSRMKRSLPDLAQWLYRETAYPTGCYLLTGTGVVPPDDFTLQPGDEIRITIDPIGTLVNVVADR